MGKKQRRETAAALASVPEAESRVILATGSYIGEGFDDARLDTLFLAMPISWKGTLQQYVGRLHRLHDNKRFVQVYDYVDNYVPMLARMYERRLKGYSIIGYVIEQEAPPPPHRPQPVPNCTRAPEHEHCRPLPAEKRSGRAVPFATLGGIGWHDYFRSVSNGLRIVSPSICCPCCRSSVYRMLQPFSSALANCSAS